MRPSTSLPYKVSLWNVLTVPGAARRFNAKKGKECLPWRRNQHGQPIHNNKKNNILIVLMATGVLSVPFHLSTKQAGQSSGRGVEAFFLAFNQQGQLAPSRRGLCRAGSSS